MMMVQPGRIFARTVDEAVLAIRDKYGNGKLTIYPAHVQPRRSSGLTWYEFYIEVTNRNDVKRAM